jgi:hypothetical protein
VGCTGAGAVVLVGCTGAAVGVAFGAQAANTVPATVMALNCNIFRREIFLISILLKSYLKFVG